MESKNIKYKEYKKLLNLVALELIKSKKSFQHRNKYTVGGKTVSYNKVIKRIKKNGENYTSNRYVARFMEKTIIKDNVNLDFIPSSVSMKYEKYTKENIIDIVKRVVSYRKENHSNPKEIKVNYTILPHKHGRSTKPGCNNMGQNNGYYCGPHMLQEMFRNLTGIVVPQSTIAAWAGTTTSGTDHDGLNTAVAMFNKKYNQNIKVAWKNFSELGWSGIKKILESKNQDCGLHELYRNKYGHYTNYNKIYNSTIDVQNSLGNKCNAPCYCGYVENRNMVDAKRYLNGISQKSVMILTIEG